MMMPTVAPKSEVETLVGAREAFVAIRDFLTTSTSLGSGEDITEQTLLLESGILDSLGILHLMTFLGDRMEVEISDEDFVADNFRTVGSLARFVADKRNRDTD